MGDPTQYFDLELFARCPADYRPSRFFTRYLRSLLPPYFAEEADRLTDRTGVNFLQLWAWEAARLAETAGIPESLGDIGNYAGSAHDLLLGATARIADVYRSAYLRAVAWFRHAALIDEDDYIERSLKLCPAEPSSWDIEPQARPEWWPTASGLVRRSTHSRSGSGASRWWTRNPREAACWQPREPSSHLRNEN
jgi:hypothetical protein